MSVEIKGSASPAEVVAITSPGGLEAWQVRSDFVPLIALAFNFEGGAAQDPPGKAGAVQLLARLLDEGAGQLTSDEFQEKLAERAIELTFNAGQDAIGGSLKTLIEHADQAFELLRLALVEPRFDPDAIERVRAQTLAGLRHQANDPNSLAHRHFMAEAFPGHPYGLPVSGTPESVAAITREDLVALHGRLLARGKLKITAVGAMDEATLGRKLDAAFGGLPAAPSLNEVPAATLQGLGSRVVVDLDVPQSVIRFGYPGASWREPGFIPAYVLNHIFGGGVFTSRLFQQVREARGLAYSVGTSLSSYRRTAFSSGYTATKNERVGECLDVIASEMSRLAQEGPTEDELTKAKDYLIGSYALGFDTSTKIAHQLAQIAFENLGLDYIRRRTDLVAAVGPGDVMEAASRTIGRGEMLTVIVGRPEGL